jgi:hypothetical protein
VTLTMRHPKYSTNRVLDGKVEAASRLGIVLASPESSLLVLLLSGDISTHRVASDEIELVLGLPLPCSAPGDATSTDGAQISGTRYRDDESGIEVRCLVPGGGPLTVNGRVMRICL